VLIAEVLTRLGGARLFHLVSLVSLDDAAVLGLLHSARVSRGLLVLFAGGLVAIILFGRTLKPRPAPADADAQQVGRDTGAQDADTQDADPQDPDTQDPEKQDAPEAGTQDSGGEGGQADGAQPN